MRMRKKKHLEPRMEACAHWQEKEPADWKGRWREKLPGAAEVRLELGCGKGRFTVETARREPEVLFLAVERVPDALVMAMERARALGLENVVFICDDAALLSDWFAPGEISGLYINFCDPWPSKRHAKRRLTSEGFLKSYRDILAPGGKIWFKTDNRPLFEYSLTQFPRAGYTLSDVTFDLHADDADVVMTDFEAVFHEQGVKINRCVATLGELPDPAELGEPPREGLLEYWKEGDPIPRGMDRYVEEWRGRQRAEERRRAKEAGQAGESGELR